MYTLHADQIYVSTCAIGTSTGLCVFDSDKIDHGPPIDKPLLQNSQNMSFDPSLVHMHPISLELQMYDCLWFSLASLLKTGLTRNFWTVCKFDCFNRSSVLEPAHSKHTLLWYDIVMCIWSNKDRLGLTNTLMGIDMKKALVLVDVHEMMCLVLLYPAYVIHRNVHGNALDIQWSNRIMISFSSSIIQSVFVTEPWSNVVTTIFKKNVWAWLAFGMDQYDVRNASVIPTPPWQQPFWFFASRAVFFFALQPCPNASLAKPLRWKRRIGTHGPNSFSTTMAASCMRWSAWQACSLSELERHACCVARTSSWMTTPPGCASSLKRDALSLLGMFRFFQSKWLCWT